MRLLSRLRACAACTSLCMHLVSLYLISSIVLAAEPTDKPW